MVPLEYKGGMASGMTEIIVFAVLALAIVVLGLLMMRSLRRVSTPREDFVFPERDRDGTEEADATVRGTSDPRATPGVPGDAEAAPPEGPEQDRPRG